MKRRPLPLAITGAVLALGLIGSQRKPGLLLLDWATKGRVDKAPVAVLIELGLQDDRPTAWSGRATVRGARVVHREGYRFMDDDKLLEADAWQARSRYAAPQQAAQKKKVPAKALAQRLATVGVVLKLADVQPNAGLTVQAGDQKGAAVVPLADVLAGRAKLLWDGKGAVRRVATATPLVTAPTEDDFPAAAYGPDGTLWLAYISYTLKEPRRRTPLQQIADEPRDFRSYYTPGFGDQLFVKFRRDGRWGEPLALTGPNEDLVRCAVGVEGNGRAWVVYSANRQGNYDLYARPASAKPGSQPGPEQRLTKAPGPDLTPVLCTDQAGHLLLACQSWDEAGHARISLFTCRDGKWAEGPVLPGTRAGSNRWYPAVAAGPKGQVAVAYDVYQDGDYDVHVAVLDGQRLTDYAVAQSKRFEARPAVAYDREGRLWVAYEEGPEGWGKNYGALETDRGNPLYNVRSVRVACLVGGKLFKPAAELPISKVAGKAQMNFQTIRYGYPRLGLDARGRLWLAYRLKLQTPFGVQPGTTWLTEVRRLDGDRWTEPLEVHHSDGLLDSRPVLLPHTGGGLLVVTNTDDRHNAPGKLDNQIYAGVIDLPGEPAEPRLVPHEAPAAHPGSAEERAAVERMRKYRLAVAGKTYQLRRGEFHRHTESSFDGGSDGSLEDMFRYAIDAAALDWIANTDHDSGAGREYPWWLIQKFSDAYHVPKAFTPLFAYERSIPYPMGHRNCLFARRGIRTLPRLAEADPDKRVAGVSAQDTQMLYRYLKELDGICASHTSATSMGTDWRDNDPVYEPVVEIYQGDRNSYEKEGAPRAGYDPASGKQPANIAGWYPKGYINLALARGYRLGFQSSSDHVSTHISYCVALVEEDSREGILAALKRRHAYAATDDILVEVRSGDYLMGDEFRTKAAPTFQVRVVGAKPLERVEILKDSEVLEMLRPGGQEYRGTWADPKPARGVHYYYVRVRQSDGELAWSSPMWVDHAP
jgi:hypothetical protein